MNGFEESVARKVFCFLRVFVSVFILPFALASQTYEIKGRLEYRVFDISGKPTVQINSEFEALVSTCSWNIRTWREGDNRAHFNEVSWDPTGMYALRQIDGNTSPDLELKEGAIVEGKPSGTRRPGNSAVGTIKTERVPKEDGTQVMPLWLAFGSACYFDSVSNGMYHPVWTVDDPDLWQTNYTVKGQVVRQSSWPYLPLRANYFSDGKRYARKNDGSLLQIDEVAPYNMGYTNAIYLVRETTNLNGFSIPVEFGLNRYTPQKGGVARTELIVLTSYDGRVHSCRLVDELTPQKPTLQGKTIITDYRFSKGTNLQEAVTYSESNVWLSTGDSRLQALAQLRQQSANADARTSKGRYAFYICMLLLLVFPVFLTAKRLGRQKSTTTTNHNNV